jgi:2-polyprenyl-6-methoxyphenol hydroxylase-like FAD-dependent oxidoreductase
VTVSSDGGFRVAIAGGGIGGLVFARALERADIDAAVFERAPALAPVGAGILVQTGALLALRTLGLDAAVRAAGRDVTLGLGLTDTGKTLQATDMSFLAAELGAGIVAIHRARLQQIFASALERTAIRLDKRCTGFDDDGDGVTVRFDDGSSERADLLVGADGLHSAVRGALFGESPLRYAGYTSWRGIAPLAPDAEGRVAELWGRGLRFGYAPVSASETYWFAVANAPEGGRDEDPKRAVAERFGSFCAPVPELVAATPEDRVFRTDIHDRPPIASWSRGRVTLLGDAAHPTTPNLGQGGCMAIEDAVTLAHELATKDSHAAAFAAYEAKRVARTSKIVEASFKFGRIAQLDGAVSTALRNFVMRLTPSRVVAKELLKNARFELD